MNQNLTIPLVFSTQGKISNTSKLYLGTGYTNIPAITNLIYAPYEGFQSIKAMIQAEKIGDHEGVFENGLRIFSTPFSIINSLGQLAWYGLEGGVVFKVLSEKWANSIVPLSEYTSILGFIVCFIEGIIEIYGAARSVHFFLKFYPYDLEKLKKSLSASDPTLRDQKIYDALKQFSSKFNLPINLKDEIETLLHREDYPKKDFFDLSSKLINKIEENVYLTKLDHLQKEYLQIPSEQLKNIDEFIQRKLSMFPLPEQQKMKEEIIKIVLEKKKNALIRRVHPRLAQEIEQSVPQLIQDLQNTDPLKRKAAKENAEEIFDHVKIQSQKKILIHSIGIAAVLITIAGLILSCVACPFFLPLIVMTIGGTLAFAQYYLNAGLIDSKGWEYKVGNCVPNLIKSIYEKATLKKKQKMPEPATLKLNYDIDRAMKNKLQEKHFGKSNFDFRITVPNWVKV